MSLLRPGVIKQPIEPKPSTQSSFERKNQIDTAMWKVLLDEE